MIGRRAFLATLGTALVGAGVSVTFDPKSGLWVPPSAVSQAVIDEQLELNDLAIRFAQKMRDRLMRHKALVLREVVTLGQWRTSGEVIAPGVLRLESDGAMGHFEPWETRKMKCGPVGRNAEAFLTQMADQMAPDIWREHGIDAFAPIGRELRAGVPLVDILVGVGSDLESGLSARAMRFTQRTAHGPEVLTGLELAIGQWQSRRARKKRSQGIAPYRFLAPELRG